MSGLCERSVSCKSSAVAISSQDRRDEKIVFYVVMGGQILFGREDVKQDAVQQVASGSRIILDQDIFQFDNLHFDLIMMFSEDRYVVFRVFYPF